MLAVELAHRTERIKIGCAFNILPTWHPLRLAEDYATADILSRGRIVFGIGRGYHSREVETFGNPMLDAEANRELFEEQTEIILMLLVVPPAGATGQLPLAGKPLPSGRLSGSRKLLDEDERATRP